MRKILLTATAAFCVLSLPAHAQVAGKEDDAAIVVEGERNRPTPSIVGQLKSMISEADSEQLSRFEFDVCPTVIGMPRDYTAALLRMIRANIVASGGEVAEPGKCSINAAVIFIDRPRELVTALYRQEPTFFHTMTPREFLYFADDTRPVYSWHLTNVYSRDGVQIEKINRNAAATRLYTNIREEMDLGVVVVDRSRTEGKSLRQLADLVTMHLLLDVRQDAGRRDRSSILSLFEQRRDGVTAPMRMSAFDRGAVAGLYGQKENNRTAAQQRQNIARVVERTTSADADNNGK